MAVLEDLWRDFAFNPNADQEAAIRHAEGPLYLPAGPGSGKTRVLLWRTTNLVVFHGVAPDQIFLATFTEKAAQQLTEGLRTLLAAASNHTGLPYDTSRLYVGTVHSLCQRLLTDRRFYAARERGHVPVLMDDLDQYLHLARRRTWASLLEAANLGVEAETTINRFFNPLYASPSRHTAIVNCIALFNRLSEECVDPDIALRLVEEPVFSRLLDMYRAYKASLTHDITPETDFSLLQQCALDVLDRYPDSKYAFRHVILDEYQDTNTVQERIFLRLAGGHNNICVVGDDDQALYRFRGATVENFVEFPARCRQHLGLDPRHILLATNYRSRKNIVSFCGAFLSQCDWRKAPPAPGYYRVMDKQIVADKIEDGMAVVASSSGNSTQVAAEISVLVRRLIDAGKVQDPNQIAFLYPSLKSAHVERMMLALEGVGLRSYAPRARTFVECDEATDMLGLFTEIFGRLPRGAFPGQDYRQFHDWLDTAQATGRQLVEVDQRLSRFVADRRQDLARASADYVALRRFVERQGWALDGPYSPETMKRALGQVPGLSDEARRTLFHPFFDTVVARRMQEGRPFPLDYVLKRATSIDWSLLDLFYRCCGFGHFISMFELAQRSEDPDEGPVANLGLLSQYLSRFMDQRAPIITGALLQDDGFLRLFFGSYLYALYRRGESEYEDAEDPFPKGRIPFLTIHQSKGLEFPVVVLGNLRKDDKGPQRVEEVVRPLLPPNRGAEPLERIAGFDIMRMYYVALSRAENLLVLADMRGRGQRINKEFRELVDDRFPRIPALDVTQIPVATPNEEKAPKTYSYTGDYLSYRRCPRQYLIFHRLGFAPSRSQTMLFGSLVHRTLDDLHQYLIAQRRPA